MKIFLKVCLFLFLFFSAVNLSAQTRDSFDGVLGGVWYDTDGVPIQAHGGQVQKIGDKWWWIGEDKTDGYRTKNGISLYSSDDLYNWKFEGYVMRALSDRTQLDTEQYFIDLYGDRTTEGKDSVYAAINTTTSVIERPKMLHNETTGKYIIWFHADGPTVDAPNSGYAAAAAGVAVADEITGPYTFIKRSRLHQLPDEDYGDEWYEAEGNRGMARDMTLFKDDDGTAYIIYSSEENRTMFISRLNDEYTDLDVSQTPVGLAQEGIDFVRLFPGAQREAPALFKYNEKYYMITSGATGWDPNAARYWMADDILGEWTSKGDPCVNEPYLTYPANKTFGSQSTNVIPIDPANGKFIYMGDRWKSSNLGDSRYIWLPVYFKEDGRIELRNVEEWNLGLFDVRYDASQFSNIYFSDNDLPLKLEGEVLNNNTWEEKELPITWDKFINTLPCASLTKLNGMFTVNETSQKVTVYGVNVSDSLLYFVDCGAMYGSDLHGLIVEENLSSLLLNKTEYDKAFTNTRGWGYTSRLGVDFSRQNDNSKDVFKSGWYALEGGTIDYKFKVNNGNYILTAGFEEWWGKSRNMKISLIYQNKEQVQETKILGTFANESLSVQEHLFALENLDPDSTYIKISVSKAEDIDLDPILSWLAITMASSEISGNPDYPYENNLFSVYPNPLTQNQSLYVDVHDVDATSENINIYNTSGQLVTRQNIIGQTNRVDLFIPSGVYLVKIKDKTEKLIIK